jgi:eukaryotic-like serine/threonine-protein kinase
MPDSRQGGARESRPDPVARDSSEPKAPDPLIGHTVDSRFRILSLIARGGMGKVYRAEQAPLGRICALKVLNPNYDGESDPEFHKRFFLEAATAAKLSHPNTVTIFDYGKSEDEIYYIAMEYLEGRTLHRVLREDGPFPENRAAHIARQICRSLREAHGHGVVHRDLKPANVLLVDHSDEKDHVKVLDFGLVKDVSGKSNDDLTQAGLFMGSPKYMAPEQITGTGVSPATDVYSLGVVLFEMLCGKVPFDRGKSVVTLMAHVNEQPPAMTSMLPGLVMSATMEAIVYKCLEKDPANRYQSMNELLNALKRLGSGEWMSDTNEALLAVSYSGLHALRAPTPPGGAPAPTGTYGSGPVARGAFVSPSMTDMNAAQQAEVPSTPPLRPSRGRFYVGAAVGVIAVGLGAFAVMSPGPTSNVGTDHAVGNTTAATIASPTSAPSTTPTGAPSTDPTSTSQPGPRVVRIESEPAGATVSENGNVLCQATPCNVTWEGAAAEATHKLQIAKAGLVPATIKVSAGEQKISAKLEVPRTSGGAATTKSTSPEGFKEDPFAPKR